MSRYYQTARLASGRQAEGGKEMQEAVMGGGETWAGTGTETEKEKEKETELWGHNEGSE